MISLLVQSVISGLQRQLDRHHSDVTQLQDAFSVVEDDVFREFCQLIGVSNIRYRYSSKGYEGYRSDSIYRKNGC